MRALGMDWEWIVVDDHSRDGTFDVLFELAGRDAHVKALRLSRNFGSHAAITCGIRQAAGNCCIVLAADLQDPPEIIPELVTAWHSGGQIVWAVRRNREGEKRDTILLARAYYWLMRRMVGIESLPASGADFFLLDRRVMDAFCRFGERNVSILALLSWMGFRQNFIEYDKQARLYGASGWTLGKKIKLALDSITSFSYLPIRAMSMVGIVTALLGFFYAGFVLFNALVGHPIEGWSSIMLVVLIIGGFQMLMLGVLGEYLWRTLEESKERPSYLVEATVGDIAAKIKER
jgi:dolichol-phosphate mannosyltransferase